MPSSPHQHDQVYKDWSCPFLTMRTSTCLIPPVIDEEITHLCAPKPPNPLVPIQLHQTAPITHLLLADNRLSSPMDGC